MHSNGEKMNLLLQLLLFVSSFSYPYTHVHAQAPWTGDMHPLINFPPGCNITKTDDCSPTYEQLEQANALWSCPSGTNSSLTCGGGGGGSCVQGTGENPICNGLNAESPCCCPKVGCSTQASFNWVVGVCKGHGCACGSSHANSCAPQNRSNQCASDCTGPSVPCCFGQDVTDLQPYYNEGTHAKVNYIAAYQYDSVAQNWVMQPESSFNTDGRFPTYDMMKAYGGLDPSEAWLAPQPGGAVFWSLGYYPAGVPGVGKSTSHGVGGGAMFVLSTEDWFGGTWYMLNSLTIDRGPGNSMPSSLCSVTNDNCWAAGNGGEMDFLEPGWLNPATASMNYTQSFSTQNNQVGRCFTGGINSGGFNSKNYILTEQSPVGNPNWVPEPIVYVAVVDSVGVWVYRIPAPNITTIWPGLGRTGANATVQAHPDILVNSVSPGITSYAMTFTSNCQATNYTAALQQNCEFNGQQGFCGNWFSTFSDTQQPLFPSQDCVKDVRGGVTMPWCKCMVGEGDC